MSAVQMVTATAPLGVGQCTQVGYAADNPGYDVNAAAAPRLAHIITQVGPACTTAASVVPSATERPATTPTAAAPAGARPATPTASPSAVRQTTPAAPPSTPAQTATAAPPAASATSAGCYPLSDDGTCNEPGDYCRAYDAGMSGVAGDGEAITCEYDHGWRWVPA